MEKPAEILDRDVEWGVLGRRCESSRPELVFVLGRRRVGKSHVLSRLARAHGGVYFQATRRTGGEQLADLCRVIGGHFEDSALTQGATLPSWEALFSYLTGRWEDRPLLLVLDEFPYLAAAEPALTSILQRFWDHEWQETRLKLVLCGSYVTAMRQLEAGDQPLHGRRTGKAVFQAFGCRDAARFVPEWNVRDRLLLYGTVGNLPGHLALVDPTRSLEENVASLMLDPSGRLVDEAQHMLDAFVGEAGVHYSIIDAVANGERTWNGITKRVGRSGGALSRPLRWLEEMRIVERVVPVTLADRRRAKRILYRIADPYIRFWHRVVAPLVRAGSIGLVSPEKLWTEVVASRIDDHMGDVFEDVCRQHATSGDLPFEPVRVGSWWDARSRSEADVVAVSADDRLFVAECKWGPVTHRDLAALRTRSRLVAAEIRGAGPVHLGLYTARGEADEAVLEAEQRGEVSVFGPEALA
ncbi:MAG: ATP-binding protein [Planctomycetota bacterium]